MFNNKPLLSFDKIFDCAQMLLVYSIKTVNIMNNSVEIVSE